MQHGLCVQEQIKCIVSIMLCNAMDYVPITHVTNLVYTTYSKLDSNASHRCAHCFLVDLPDCFVMHTKCSFSYQLPEPACLPD